MSTTVPPNLGASGNGQSAMPSSVARERERPLSSSVVKEAVADLQH